MPGNQLVQSVLRSLSLVEIVSSKESGLTLTEISEASGIKITTVHNLIRTLMHKGYLKYQERNSRYQLGPTFVELGRLSMKNELREAAGNEVKGLFEALQPRSVSYFEASELEIVVRFRMTADIPGILKRPDLEFAHPYRYGTGVLFQALWDDNKKEAYRERYVFSQLGLPFWDSETDLDKAMEQVKRDRFLYSPDSSHYGFCAPIFDRTGHIIASLNVTLAPGNTSSQERESVKRLTLAAAKKLMSG